MNGALREAEFGNAARAQELSTSALTMASTRDVQILAALAFARAGDSTRAQRLANEVQKQFPLDTIIGDYWLPTVRAAIEIDRSNPTKAIEFLKAAAPYELGEVSNFEFGICSGSITASCEPLAWHSYHSRVEKASVLLPTTVRSLDLLNL
jgi:hypothetical protein